MNHRWGMDMLEFTKTITMINNRRYTLTAFSTQYIPLWSVKVDYCNTFKMQAGFYYAYYANYRLFS